MCAESLIVSASATGGVTAASFSDTDTIKVGSGSGFGGGGGGGGEGVGVDDDTEAVAKSAVTLYANFIHFLFNELISV